MEGLLRVGDKVVIEVSDIYRSVEGYNPCPNGTTARVLGFDETYQGRVEEIPSACKPGVYSFRMKVFIQREDGIIYPEWSWFLKPADKDLFKQRWLEKSAQGWEEKKSDAWSCWQEFIRELPNTPFWQGDFVSFRKGSGRIPRVSAILDIDYRNLKSLLLYRNEYPAAYKIPGESPYWSWWVSAQDIELNERGRVWKFYHGEQLTFENLEDEAVFFSRLSGYARVVMNSKSARWRDREEIVAAIKKGLFHGITENGFAICFKEDNLGQRVAEATLKRGFSLPAAAY